MTADLVPFDFTVHIWLDNFRGTKPFKMRSYSKLEIHLSHHPDMNIHTKTELFVITLILVLK